MAKSDTADTTTTTDSEPAKDAPAPKATPKSDAPTDAGKAKEGESPADNSLEHGKGPLEMSLKAYLRGSGRKPDQTAGFASYATRELSGRRTQADWEQAFSDFHAKPLR